MRKFFGTTTFVILIFALASCGKGSGTTGPSVSKVGPGFREAPGQIYLSKNGQLFGILYIVGSCDGSDNAGKNVNSSGSRDGKLRPESGTCNTDVAFSLDILGRNNNWIDLLTTIRSFSGNLATVSLPIDTTMEAFPTATSRWRTSGNRVTSGCERSGAFSTIPQPCVIPNLPPDNNRVGRVADLDPYRYAEISGPFGGIRREKIGGDCSRIQFYRHTGADGVHGTNNIEVGFPIPSDRIILHSGRTLTCRERISIF